MNKRNTLLIGSDIDSNRISLRDLFHDFYHLLEANSAEQASLLLKQNRSIISCVLLDIDHEFEDAYQLLESVHASGSQKEIPTVVLVPPGIGEDEEVKLDARSTDVIRKPCPSPILMRRIRSFIDLYQERTALTNTLQEKLKLLQHSNDQMMDALSNIIEQRSLESGQHIQRIRGYTYILLEEIAASWPEYGLTKQRIERMARAAALHDIGKISIPDAILNKPGYLTKEEFEIMQAHTVNGCKILEQLWGVADEEYLTFAYHICRYHHERWDGRGYPDGLQREEIPICAQAAGVADVYDALTTDRVYKSAYHSDRAAAMILNGECGAFSPKVLESFKACFPKFVELERHYKENNIYEYTGNGSETIAAETPKVTESAAERLQARHQALLYYQNATVLEADLITGVFHLLYNPNPDYYVPDHAKHFRDFATQVANEQMSPDDRERFLQEVAHCHSALFELGQRKHSVYARMKGAATGKYRPYEFATIRIDSEDPDARDVLLICRPLDETPPDFTAPDQSDWLQEHPQIQSAVLSNLLLVRHDDELSIMGEIGALYELSNYTRQEITEQFQGSFMRLVHPEDRQALAARIRERLAVGIVADASFRITARDGAVVWVLARFYLFTDSRGEDCLCAILQNDSESHAAWEKLQDAASYREAFLRQSDDITFVWDILSDECTFDEKWNQRFGYEPCKAKFNGTLIGANHLHPDDLPGMNAFLEKLRSGESFAEADVRFLRVHGGYLWNRLRAGVVYDAGGKAVKAIGSILDIDALKRDDVDADDQFRKLMADAWSGTIPSAAERDAFFEYTFRRFQQAEDFDAELVNILKTIGMAAKVGRIYLYEIDESRKECRKTIEWRAEDVAPATAEQASLLYNTGYAAWEKLFDKNGVLYIPDTSLLAESEQFSTRELGVQSILQYKIEDEGYFYGFVGFDTYNNPRIWTTTQIEGFHHFVHILALFLIKDRTQKRSRQHTEELMTILNNQDIWAYVIDNDYCLQFINEKMKAFVPAGRDKQRCYEVFMRRSFPCPNCPAIGIKEKITASAEMENPYLNLRMRSTATAIRWKGQDATLLRCASLRDPSLPETAPKPAPFKAALHQDALRRTGCIDCSDPELMMAALQALMDHLPGIVYVKDLNLTYRASNQGLADMAGQISSQEVIGKIDSEILEDQKLARRYTSDDRKVLNTGKSLIDYIEPRTEEDGEPRYLTTSKYALTDKTGRAIGVLGLSRDVTQEIRFRNRYEKEVEYLFTLPQDIFVARLIDVDDWRIVGQKTKAIHGTELPHYDSVEQMLEDVRWGLQDESAKDSLCFYEEFSPVQLRNLHNSGHSQIEMEHIYRFRDGTSSWVRNELKFLINPFDGHRCVMVIVTDIDSTRKSEDELLKVASTDSLTGALNRGAGVRKIEEFLSTEGKDGQHAVFVVDVDNFKSVNDLFGHPVGDKFLCDLAGAIRSCFRSDDLVIRMGGDEFLILVKNISTHDAVQKKAEALLKVVRNVRPADTAALVSVSVGISMYPEDGTDQEALFVMADQALYRAKSAGKNQAAFASDENVLYNGGHVAMSYEEYNSFAADHTDVYSYISDLKTRELLYLNRVAMTAHGIASPDFYKGKKCYEVLFGRNSPCPHCTSDKLQEGKPYRWVQKNEALGKTFKATALKVHINGRWCRLANAQECEDI